MAAIVREEAPALDEKVSAPLRWVIDRCLQKERQQRYESTRDLYRELRNLRDHFSEAYSSGGFAPVAMQAKRHRWKLPVTFAGCTLLVGLLVYLLKPTGPNIGNYRYTPFATDAAYATWSPDGKAVAYTSKVNGTYQVFLRYLNSPVPLQLTHDKHNLVPQGWSNDRSHLIVVSAHLSPQLKFYSLPTVGGELEFIMDFEGAAWDLSRDGKAFAALTSGKQEEDLRVQVSDPLGSPLRDYRPAFLKSSKQVDSNSFLSFSPDGKNILLLLPRGGGIESWLLPYPAGSRPPHQIPILKKLPLSHCCPRFAWMPGQPTYRDFACG
jgi:hypothetical protein